jgi:U3 small nucleolar RNA-associated protein 10
MALTTLQSIVTSSSVPSAITRRLTRLLIDIVVSSKDTDDTASQRAMLSTIQQRYPSILQKTTEEIIPEKEDIKEAIEQLIISLSMASASATFT